MYPERVYRTRSNLDAQKRYDKYMRQIVEWRKTFAPKPEDSTSELFNDPGLLDEFYCRDLLKGIRAVVDRTLQLSHLTLSGISNSEFVYLREAANCYILGLPEAAVALARAAVEDCLRTKLAKFLGKKAVADAKLENLLHDLAPRGFLSRQVQDSADKVRLAANIVLHRQTIGQPEALAVLEQARSVIFELSRH
jgi:uncharacterized protein DUF4145